MGRLPAAGPLVVPSTAQIRLIWTSGTRTFHNVVHAVYTSSAIITPGLPDTILTSLSGNAATTTWLTHLAPGVGGTALVGLGVRDIGAPNLPEFMAAPVSHAGTGTGTALPISVAMVVTLRTNQTGQGFRGRLYLAGMVDAVLANTLDFTAGVGTDGIGFVNAIKTTLAASSLTMAIAQRKLNAGTHHDGTPWPQRDAVSVPVTSVSIANPRVDSQRRRLGR